MEYGVEIQNLQPKRRKRTDAEEDQQEKRPADNGAGGRFRQIAPATPVDDGSIGKP